MDMPWAGVAGYSAMCKPHRDGGVIILGILDDHPIAGFSDLSSLSSTNAAGRVFGVAVLFCFDSNLIMFIRQ